MIANIGQYELYLRRGSRRESTVNSRLKAVRFIIRELDGEILASKFEQLILKLFKEKRSISRINNLIECIRLWGDCFGDKDLSSFKYYKKEENLKSTLSDTEIENILKIEPESIYTLFFATLAFTGMRPGELAQMTIDRVDFGEGVFRLRAQDTKTHKPRIVPIPEHTRGDLEKHIKSLRGEFLFPSYRSSEPTLTQITWGYQFRKRLNKLGIKRSGLTVYSLRHSIITRLLDEDVNLFGVQNLVGHSRITTTARYYHNSIKAIKKAVSRDPLTRKSKPIKEVFDELVNQVQQFISTDGRFTVSTDRSTPDKLIFKISSGE